MKLYYPDTLSAGKHLESTHLEKPFFFPIALHWDNCKALQASFHLWEKLCIDTRDVLLWRSWGPRKEKFWCALFPVLCWHLFSSMFAVCALHPPPTCCTFGSRTVMHVVVPFPQGDPRCLNVVEFDRLLRESQKEVLRLQRQIALKNFKECLRPSKGSSGGSLPSAASCPGPALNACSKDSPAAKEVCSGGPALGGAAHGKVRQAGQQPDSLATSLLDSLLLAGNLSECMSSRWRAGFQTPGEGSVASRSGVRRWRRKARLPPGAAPSPARPPCPQPGPPVTALGLPQRPRCEAGPRLACPIPACPAPPRPQCSGPAIPAAPPPPASRTPAGKVRPGRGRPWCRERGSARGRAARAAARCGAVGRLGPSAGFCAAGPGCVQARCRRGALW